MTLYPEQRAMLAEFFAGTTETLIIQPKKNGKTSLLAALALCHLTTTPDAACFIGAASRDQASILYEQASGIVRRSPWLQAEVDVKGGYRSIRSRHDAGSIRVLAADANTADGVLPTLALVDELHRHKSGDLYGIFRDGLGPRAGQMLTISTAGEDDESPLGILRTTAYALPGVVREGAYRHVAAGGFALHEWALDADQDLDDLELVKTANPAPWQTIEKLADRKRSPSMTAGRWARFAAGVWGVGSNYAFDRETWDALADPEQNTIEPGRKIVLGFDGARRRDTTALVACDIETGHLIGLGVWERPPNADEDWEIDEGEVDQIVDYAFETWDVWKMYGDPPFWETALDRWAGRYGAAKVTRWWTNRLKATALAVRQFANDMRPDEMSHSGDEVLTRHIRNAVRQTTKMIDDGDELFVIRKDARNSPRKIDAAMAAVLAWQARGDAIKNGALEVREYGRAAW